MRQFNNTIYPIERVISSATYLTTGMAGFIWLIIAAVIKKRVTPFLMYHILQSIFISIAYFIFISLYRLTFIIFAKIPLINAIVFGIDRFFNAPLILFYGLSLLQIVTTIIILYLAITSFCGKYSYIPWVSDIINNNTGRK